MARPLLDMSGSDVAPVFMGEMLNNDSQNAFC